MAGNEIDIEATLTAKGQITIPSAIREQLNARPGDKICFAKLKAGGYKITARKKRSILDLAREKPLPRLERPLTNEDIDNAIGDAVTERAIRAGLKPPK